MTVSRWQSAGLWEILAAPQAGAVVFVGAGGKSACLGRLVREWRADSAGHAGGLILTVTTRLKDTQANLADRLFFTEGTAERPRVLPGEVLLVAGRPLPVPGKIEGITGDSVCCLAGQNPGTPILVESDGAAGALVKVPGPQEPVIPPCAGVVVVVTGFPALGQPTAGDRIHRREAFTRLFGSGAGTLTPEVMARLLRHPGGAFKGTPASARRYWLINQADTEDAVVRAIAFAEQADPFRSCDGVIIGSARSNRPFLVMNVQEAVEES